MKKRIILIILATLPLLAMAQPAWVKKATKSVFTLKTFAEDGSLIGSSNGFFTSANGDAVSNFTPFKGAARAVVIDAAGKEMPVVSIVGVNDMYDVVKFRVSGKTQPLTISTGATTVGSQVWLLPYHEVKAVPAGVVRKAETFQGEYEYYTVAMTMPANTVNSIPDLFITLHPPSYVIRSVPKHQNDFSCGASGAAPAPQGRPRPPRPRSPDRTGPGRNNSRAVRRR